MTDGGIAVAADGAHRFGKPVRGEIELVEPQDRYLNTPSATAVPRMTAAMATMMAKRRTFGVIMFPLVVPSL